jgi:hypothetical protein
MVGIYDSSYLSDVYEIKRQVLPTVPSPTTTDLISSIAFARFHSKLKRCGRIAEMRPKILRKFEPHSFSIKDTNFSHPLRQAKLLMKQIRRPPPRPLSCPLHTSPSTSLIPSSTLHFHFLIPRYDSFVLLKDYSSHSSER